MLTVSRVVATIDTVLSIFTKLLQLMTFLAIVYVLLVIVRVANDPNPSPNLFTKIVRIVQFAIWGCDVCNARMY